MSQKISNEPGSGPRMDVRGVSIARNTLLNFVSQSIPILIGFVTIPITIRLLGLDRFAVLSIAWVVVGYFSFFDLGLGRSATKFIAESIGQGRLDDIPGLFWTAVCSQFLLGAASSILIALFNPLLVKKILNVPLNFQGEMITTLYILSLSMPIVFVSSSFRGTLEAAQRFDLSNAIRIPASALNFILPVIGGLLGMQLPGIMILIFISRVAAAVGWMYLALKLFPNLRTRTKISMKVLKPLFSFGGWVTISSLMSPLLGTADRFIIGSILPLKMISYYSPPSEMLGRLGIIPGSLVLTLFPAFSYLGLAESKERAVLFFNRSVKYLLILMGLVVGLILFYSKSIISLWLGQDFLALSAPVLQILALGFFMNALAQVPFAFLQGMGRADITAKFHMAEALGYVPLLWLFISKWGINGAAAGWTIRVTLDLLLLLWASLSLAKIRISALHEHGLTYSLMISLSYLILAMIPLKGLWTMYFFAFISVGYIISQWAFSLDKDERHWFRQRARNVVRFGKTEH